MRMFVRAWSILLVAVCLLCAANVKLFMKDGSYQLVREYQVQNDRVRFYSTDRDEWEEVPAALVDLEKTKAEIKQRQDSVREDAQAADAEEKAEREARREVERIPVENGVYLIEGDKLVPVKVGESKIVSNKRRTVLKVLTRYRSFPARLRWSWTVRIRRRAR